MKHSYRKTRTAYETPSLETLFIQPEQGYAVSGSLENVTEEGAETQW